MAYSLSGLVQAAHVGGQQVATGQHADNAALVVLIDDNQAPYIGLDHMVGGIAQGMHRVDDDRRVPQQSKRSTPCGKREFRQGEIVVRASTVTLL